MRYFIVIEIGGEVRNVFAENETEQGVLGGSMIKNLGL